MADVKLTFHKSLTVADFKAQNNNNGVEIVNNPNSGKLFFVCGSVTGAVSKDYVEAPQFSLVSGEDNVEFWLLHKKQTSNIVATL